MFQILRFVSLRNWLDTLIRFVPDKPGVDVVECMLNFFKILSHVLSPHTLQNDYVSKDLGDYRNKRGRRRKSLQEPVDMLLIRFIPDDVIAIGYMFAYFNDIYFQNLSLIQYFNIFIQ